MKQALKKLGSDDFEEFGYQTRLACGDTASAIQICGLRIQAGADELQPEVSNLNSEIIANRHHGAALHAHLYDRPVPVSDARMLTHSLVCSILLTLAVLASIACLVGNATTFMLLGLDLPLSMVCAVGNTALPLVAGHLVYEKIVAGHRGLQLLVIAGMAVLCYGALLKLGAARREMVDKAAATTATSSYVDEPAADTPTAPEALPKEDSETKIHHTMGEAMLWFMLAADIALGVLVALFVQKRTDEDYAAWRKLKTVNENITALETRVAELLCSIEIAKKRCMAGILRAEKMLARRRPPYHQALTLFLVLVLFASRPSWAQKIERYEGILIDTSGSISRGGTTNELFREYLASTKKLLLTEPPNSRVWVSSISTDSFGGVREVLKGWTPDSRGVFTEDLNHAQRELAARFVAKSAGMTPVAAGTDIVGSLWHLKGLFESGPTSASLHPTSKTIWIFSDMVNETKALPMPALIETGSEQMLQGARAKRLLVPLNGYKVYVCGASLAGLTLQTWTTLKHFWIMYFSAAGAEVVEYSVDCDLRR